ncbi:transcriptional regulator, BadM/Rrf2 family [Marininema mesophilum]|uniref:Transcriptional regulator, BadM/Rrf2 family n=1 Tax=Marininema mesophilum TaxID=1048340 RepID=A0A1H2WDJ3_9BACL|nr:Rrf2 family transcriptional regulator [Marininema mesophilum]SDW78611.1 transcriptional regulator, BadM/Rrf2 family [Marininema mesophilum]
MNSDFSLAVHSLALFALHPEKKRTSDELAENTGVHPVRMRRSLGLLKKNGYIRSKEGAGGGFSLACNPDVITLDRLYHLTCPSTLQPKSTPVNCECPVGSILTDVLNDILSDGEDVLTRYLKQWSISDVVNHIQDKKQCDPEKV